MVFVLSFQNHLTLYEFSFALPNITFEQNFWGLLKAVKWINYLNGVFYILRRTSIIVNIKWKVSVKLPFYNPLITLLKKELIISLQAVTESGTFCQERNYNILLCAVYNCLPYLFFPLDNAKISLLYHQILLILLFD